MTARQSRQADVAKDLSATLLQIASAMSRVGSPWWIIGSAAVLLHGIETSVADVDVLCGDEVDARALIAVIGGRVIESDGDPVFRSTVFGRTTMTPIPVEIMVGLHVRGEPIRLTAREWRHGAPVPSRNELIVLLERFGREKDIARAALLRVD